MVRTHFSLRNSDVNVTENWTNYLFFICRESELRPSRSLPESSSRSTTRSWPMTSTPTRRSPVRSPSFLPREWETRLQASSPTWWRESSRSLFVEFRWSFKRRRERPDLTSSLRYECYSPWVAILACSFVGWISYLHVLFLLQKSALEQEVIKIDPETKDMLDAMNFKDLSFTKLDE